MHVGRLPGALPIERVQVRGGVVRLKRGACAGVRRLVLRLVERAPSPFRARSRHGLGSVEPGLHRYRPGPASCRRGRLPSRRHAGE
ncbi:hypothetical protein [Sphingomonas abaci]|uniref:Uncharacterized protein n=1 Tax=Sphingomonas abaci TaxID=237611 RepID=A0A7W7AL49_9SPHN|nr:hypothetical protein [Sphingomonas abaci]MBB4618209.1 hypothetical protein [Sphingomonas abaci]